MAKNKYLSLFIILLITFTASAVGSFITTSFKEPWYSEIILPSFNPPSWVFAPVWTTLYIMMAFSIWKIWIKNYNIKLIKIYFLHLFFNAIWSIIFFGLHKPFFALLDLIVILIFILYLMKSYLRIDKISFYMMIPYFLWSSYALILNFNIVLLNN